VPSSDMLTPRVGYARRMFSSSKLVFRLMITIGAIQKKMRRVGGSFVKDDVNRSFVLKGVIVVRLFQISSTSVCWMCVVLFLSTYTVRYLGTLFNCCMLRSLLWRQERT
jgi:hypothetical protein